MSAKEYMERGQRALHASEKKMRSKAVRQKEKMMTRLELDESDIEIEKK